MDQRYHLPVQALVEVLKGSAQMLRFVAPLSSVPGILRQPCLAQIVLGQGSIASCTILTPTGQGLLHDQSAYEALARCGDLDWQLAPTPCSPRLGQHEDQPPMERPARRAEVLVPTLHTPLTKALLTSLPHSARRVLPLVDGKRSIADIAHLLAKTPEELYQQLKHLDSLVRL